MVKSHSAGGKFSAMTSKEGTRILYMDANLQTIICGTVWYIKQCHMLACLLMQHSSSIGMERVLVD